MKKVVCVGDSITEGFGLAEQEAYPYLLVQRLGDGYEVFNAGVTAHCVINETAADGRTMGLPYVRTERYAEALAQAGDIYVVMLGTNDAQDGLWDDGNGKDPYSDMISLIDRFDYHYKSILKDIRRVSPEAVIYMVRPVPVLNCIWPKHQQKYLDIVLEHLDGIAAEDLSLRVIDMTAVFRAKGQEWMEAIYQADRLHPGPEGARLIADTVYEAIKE